MLKQHQVTFPAVPGVSDDVHRQSEAVVCSHRHSSCTGSTSQKKTVEGPLGQLLEMFAKTRYHFFCVEDPQQNASQIWPQGKIQQSPEGVLHKPSFHVQVPIYQHLAGVHTLRDAWQGLAASQTQLEAKKLQLHGHPILPGQKQDVKGL